MDKFAITCVEFLRDSAFHAIVAHFRPSY